jgi:hypothetical protein
MKAKISGVISYPVPPVVDPLLVAISRQELEVVLEPTSSTPEAVVIEVNSMIKYLVYNTYCFARKINIYVFKQDLN